MSHLFMVRGWVYFISLKLNFILFKTLENQTLQLQ